jgi:hypothetical protein
MLALLAAAALATAPCCSHRLDAAGTATVTEWLKLQPNLRAAVETDSECPESIEKVRRGSPGSPWVPVPDYHPYRVAADFNRDGQRDVAVVVVDAFGDVPRYELVVFNGPVQPGALPSFRADVGAGVACGGLFIGPPRPEPFELLVGRFESDNSVALVPDGEGYRFASGDPDGGHDLLPAAEAEALRADVAAIGAAVEVGDAEPVIARTYHTLKDLMGGEEAFAQVTRQALEGLRASNVRFVSSEVGLATETYPAGEDIVTFVPRVSVMEVNGKRVRATSFMIAVRPAPGGQWMFLDGAGLKGHPEMLEKLLPALAKDVPLPPNTVEAVE